MSKKLIISGYRCLLRYANELSNIKSSSCLIMPLDNSSKGAHDSWGKHRWYDSEQSNVIMYQIIFNKRIPIFHFQLFML